MGIDLASWLPFGFSGWHPWMQAGFLFALTFISEDLTTVSAALLFTSGGMGWDPAFWGSYLGVWLGDAFLYGLGRGVGRPLLERRWARRMFDPEAVARSEQWFATKGLRFLFLTRVLPGTRSPTYVAAGFLRVPFGPFFLISGVTSIGWVLAIFGLAHLAGNLLIGWLARWRWAGWILFAGVVSLVIWLIWRKAGASRAAQGGGDISLKSDPVE